MSVVEDVQSGIKWYLCCLVEYEVIEALDEREEEIWCAAQSMRWLTRPRRSLVSRTLPQKKYYSTKIILKIEQLVCINLSALL